ncbi:MAG: LysM peptidoglycan-binding domain-containing protein, partial [Burkholderiaceae bacterium]
MKRTSLIILAIISMLLAACSTPQRTAPIVDRNPDHKRPADTSKVATTKPTDVNGLYTVKKGDTLFHIALEFGQNYRDLVAWNNLANANDIKVDQVLRVLPPAVEAGGAQTSSVATTSGIEIRPLSVAQPAQTTNAAPNKVGPLGNKQPYSETALLELQKPDASSYAVTTLPSTEANPNEKAVDKSIDANSLINSDDKNIAWMWPADGKVVATFDDGKKGIDIAGKTGQPVLAAGSGKVMYAGSG